LRNGKKTYGGEISIQLNNLTGTFMHNKQTLTIPNKNHHPLVSPKTGNAQPAASKVL